MVDLHILSVACYSKERSYMASNTLNVITKYFWQFYSKKGLLRLLIASLVTASSFKLIAGYVHPCENYEVVLLLASGIVPFFLITIISRFRYSLPLSLIAITLFYFMLRSMALAQI